MLRLNARFQRSVTLPQSSFRRRPGEFFNSEAGHRFCISVRQHRSEELSSACGSLGRAFRTGALPVRKGVDIPVDSRYAACRPGLIAAQVLGRAAGHSGPHSVPRVRVRKGGRGELFSRCTSSLEDRHGGFFRCWEHRNRTLSIHPTVTRPSAGCAARFGRNQWTRLLCSKTTTLL